MIPVSYNLRNLTVRKATSAAAILGLSLVVFVFAAAMMLSNGIRAATSRAADPNIAIVLRKGSVQEMESGIDATKVSLIAATPGVTRLPNGHPAAVGELVAVIMLPKKGKTVTSNVQVRGIADDTLAFRPTVKIVAGRAAKPGTDEVIVGQSIVGRFEHLDLGQSVEIRKNRPMTVVGVFEDGGSAFESEIWADAGLVRMIFGRTGNVSSVRVRLTSPEAFDAFKANIEANRDLDVGVMRDTDFFERQTQGTAKFFSAMGFIIAFFFSIGAVIGAMITMHATIAQRQREIGTLRALGFTRIQILSSFMIESVILSLIAGVVGGVASLAMSAVRITAVNVATFSELSFRFEATPKILASAVMVAGVMGIIGGFLPAIRAARISPVDAMRGA